MSFFDSAYIVTRYPAGSRSIANGEWIEGTPSTITVLCNIQPVTGKALESLPEGRRDKKIIKGYSNIELYTVTDGTSGKNPDRITYQGEPYEIFESRNYGTLLPHWFFQASLL